MAFDWFGNKDNDLNSNLYGNNNTNTGFQNWNLGSDAAGRTAYGNLGADQQQSFIDYSNEQQLSGSNGDFGFNNGTMKGVGSVMSGLGSLGSAWAGLQGVKLGEQSLASQQDQWNKNYDSQATTINNRIGDQNAWKSAQGRTDLGSLVPTYKKI